MHLNPVHESEIDKLPYGAVYVKIEVVQVGQSQGYPEHYTKGTAYLVSDPLVSDHNVEPDMNKLAKLMEGTCLDPVNFGPVADGTTTCSPP